MKKGIFFLLCGLIPFFSPSSSFADVWPGMCVEVHYTILDTITGNHDYGHTWTVNSVGNPVLSDPVFHDGDFTKHKVQVNTFMFEESTGAWKGVRGVTLQWIDRFGEGESYPSYQMPTSDTCPQTPCEIAGKDPISDCGSLEQTTFLNVDTCDYICSACDDEYQQALLDCGDSSNLVFDPISCSYSCIDCADQIVEAQNADCDGFGYHWTNEDLCLWECNDNCDDAFRSCQNKCFTHNGIYTFKCTVGFEGNSAECICNDDTPGTDPPPDPNPDPNPDPSPDPNPDPPPDPNPDPGDPDDDSGWLKAIKHNTDDLVDLADERNNDWLDAIKENQDVQIEQLGDSLGYQKHISEGTDTMITNQGVINNSIKAASGKIDQTNKLLGDIKGEVDLSLLETYTGLIKDSLTSEVELVDALVSNVEDVLVESVPDLETDMQDQVVGFFTNVESVTEDDAGFFKNLFVSVIPPSTTCQPLDLSFNNHELIIGCEYSDDIKNILSYLVYIFTVIAIYTLIHRELRPNTSA